MSRIDTALKPRVENSVSAELRIASRILGLRVMWFSLGLLSAFSFVQMYKLSGPVNKFLRGGAKPDAGKSTRSRAPRLPSGHTIMKGPTSGVGAGHQRDGLPRIGGRMHRP